MISEQKPKSLLNFLSSNWKPWIAAVSVAFLLVVLLISNWSSRYNAGYRVGAGEGAVYKELYRSNQDAIEALQLQHERDLANITRLTREASTKRGRISPGQNEIDKLQERLDREFAELEIERNKLLDRSIENGKWIARAQEAEKNNQELKLRLKSSSTWFGISLVGNLVLALMLLAVAAIKFLETRGMLQPAGTLVPYSLPNSISVETIESPPEPKLIEESEDSNHTALPSEQGDQE